MARKPLTGGRIREKRITLGLRQAELARRVDISASYLNLIEHNRRRIGGKLLIALAAELDVDPLVLSEGAGATLIATLREAAAGAPDVPAELDRVDEFAGRFPGWAQVLADAHGRIGALERSIERLTDRMTHDPQLAAALHEMLSTVTSIRSAASILAEPGEIDRDWQARFHRNIFEDSGRLTEASQGLVAYLEAGGEDAGTGAPQEDMEKVMAAWQHHVAVLEHGASVEVAMNMVTEPLSEAATDLLRRWLERYAKDAKTLPLEGLYSATDQHGCDPLALARALGHPAALVMRRLAAADPARIAHTVGIVVCDASGAVSYTKPVQDFPMPRLGAACPLWPLYRALSAPQMPVAEPVRQVGRVAADFDAYAVAEPITPPAPNRAPLLEATMIVVRRDAGRPADDPLELGVSCRICPRPDCVARREMSVLMEPS